MKPRRLGRFTAALGVLVSLGMPRGGLAAVPSPAHAGAPGLQFIDSGFENASPVWYEVAEDGTIQVHLLYDHERASPNRAAGHIHFLIHARPGSKLTLEFRNLENVWNGRPGSVARELKQVVTSPDGKHWTSVPTQGLPDNRVQVALEMPGPKLFLARVEPYRLSDLDRFLSEIARDRRVAITPIGQTVQGRSLEIVRVGSPRAPHRVFLRARAHPWESGGNWVLEGLVRRLLRRDADAKKFLQRYCVYILPMANKDGVVLGRTRFNLQGKDLNRDWGAPADRELAPENYALERWLEGLVRAGRAPDLAIDLHNDGSGRLHLGRPPVPDLERHLSRMTRLETLLRRHTWFTEGSTNADFQNSGTLGEGWLQRYGVDALIHELNCNWIAGAHQPASAALWREYGEHLAAVFDAYFEAR